MAAGQRGYCNAGAAKLSKQFYAKLGDEVANELVNWFNAVDATYKADLLQLNETNWARFDARLEQRVAELRAELRTEIANSKSELIRWMFGFWIGNLFATAAIVLAVVKLAG